MKLNIQTQFVIIAYLLPSFFLVPVVFGQGSDDELDEYLVIEERNFFRPREERKPKEEKKKEVPDNPDAQTRGIFTDALPTLDTLRLTGTTKIKGRYKAVLEKPDGENGFYVEAGDTVDSYIVTDINDDRILLERNEEVYTIRIANAKVKLKEKSESKKVVIESVENIKESSETILKQVETLKGERDLLLEKYTEKHPQILKLNKQIEQLQKQAMTAVEHENSSQAQEPEKNGKKTTEFRFEPNITQKIRMGIR